MYDLTRNLAVQSYCFRHYTAIPDLIGQIRKLGLTRTELCAVHADFNAPASFPGILKQFREAGIQIASIGVQYFHGDPQEEHWFDFARQAGASMISTHFVLAKIPAVFDTCAKLAEKYDLQLGIHNHGGYDWLGNVAMLEHLLKNLHPRIGLCIDTAWCLQAAGNPVEWAEKFRDKLFGIHLKDFVFDRAGKWADTIVGKGNLDLAGFLKSALAAPHLTAVTLEFEGKPVDPGPELQQCIAAVRAATPS
jgi:sugar phosphate isomerase/epimerase